MKSTVRRLAVVVSAGVLALVAFSPASASAVTPQLCMHCCIPSPNCE